MSAVWLLSGVTGYGADIVKATLLTRRRDQPPNNNAFVHGLCSIKILVVAAKMPPPHAWVGNEAT
jgi:hypothetical protein